MASTRTFQDRNFLVWEVYPAAGAQGSSDRPHLIFNCLTQPGLRPRTIDLPRADAAFRAVADLTETELIDLLEQAGEIA